ncbi:hypothetical protein CY34DRAFT_406953 [Suillus luteus UH-Slu-Lm8-n1]|uniref:Uncharacterized protein n=1 Tax=Suillus luteus UH-Slu-Lm8-n1 TaxID=930992 RepID=A0A0D0A8V7_9AGAM|nr:hypothetical protein CY34DRAFT_406953 [Suillus luteus UH-Slu-Lm8-n1]
MNSSRSFFVSPSNVAMTALDFTQLLSKHLQNHCLTLRPAVSIYIFISDPGNTDANVTHKQKTHGVGPLQLPAPLRITIFSPLTTHNLVLSLLTHFLGALFSTLPQILYRVHSSCAIGKGSTFCKTRSVHSQSSLNSEGIIWQKESFIEQYFQKRFYSFLQR